MTMSGGVAQRHPLSGAKQTGASTNAAQDANDSGLWRNPVWLWLLLLAAAAIIYWPSRTALESVFASWMGKPEYSHAIFLPVLSAFLVWQKSDILARLRFDGSWWGVALLLAASAIFFLGLMSTLYILQQYALIAMIAAFALAFVGMRAFRFFVVPIVILFLTIPLPTFLYNNLSSELQLLSSQIGVLVIRAFGIPVYLEGNVIDLGQMKLQVVEACAGLRYLFPLFSLGFVVANFFAVPMWMRIVTIISTVPITVLMNSARIGLIGVSVEYWGVEMAEGVLHDFEGWVIFMASLAVLLAEMWVLVKLTNRRARLSDVFVVEMPARVDFSKGFRPRRMPAPFLMALSLLPLMLVGGLTLEQRQEVIPQHKSLAEFPLRIDGWSGQSRVLEPDILARLMLTDYFMIDYVSASKQPLNFYVAYYGSQRAGSAIHTPRSCIPGGGWRIESIGEHSLSVNDINGKPLTVQRLLIQKGNSSQLVYYWFDQRGRVLANEFVVKWYMLLDALLKNRSDGSLVRVSVPIASVDEASIVKADRMMEQFIGKAEPILQQFLPH
jgi:exosortase D (VPLPA-CTERM-specific)